MRLTFAAPTWEWNHRCVVLCLACSPWYEGLYFHVWCYKCQGFTFHVWAMSSVCMCICVTFSLHAVTHIASRWLPSCEMAVTPAVTWAVRTALGHDLVYLDDSHLTLTFLCFHLCLSVIDLFFSCYWRENTGSWTCWASVSPRSWVLGFLFSILLFICREMGSHKLSHLVWSLLCSPGRSSSCLGLCSSWDDKPVSLDGVFLIQPLWETVWLDQSAACHLVKTSCWQNSSKARSQVSFSIFPFLLLPAFKIAHRSPRFLFCLSDTDSSWSVFLCPWPFLVTKLLSLLPPRFHFRTAFFAHVCIFFRSLRGNWLLWFVDVSCSILYNFIIIIGFILGIPECVFLMWLG